jgi:tRNA-specific adenosine deaminase 3
MWLTSVIQKTDQFKLWFQMTEEEIWRPILPNSCFSPQVPTIKAYVCDILDPKATGKIIEMLNSSFPEHKLSHLKRVNSKKNEGKLQALLSVDEAQKLSQILDCFKAKDIAISEPFLVEVPSEGGKTKTQHQHSMTLWPVTNFCADKYLESVLDGTNFTKSVRCEIEQLMGVALKAADKSKQLGGKGIGAVIAFKGQVLAIGCDARNKHPLKHAVLAAIDMVAWAKLTEKEEPPEWIGNELADCRVDILNAPQAYLCTDYDVVVTREPCTFCAMALLHNRVKRIFYGCNYENGALGSALKLHTLPDINHRYEVFGGVRQRECLEVLSTCDMQHKCFS